MGVFTTPLLPKVLFLFFLLSQQEFEPLSLSLRLRGIGSLKDPLGGIYSDIELPFFLALPLLPSLLIVG